MLWFAMEQINPADVRDDISIDRARELLGDDADGLSDDEVLEIKRHAETMARVLIEVFLRNASTVH